MKIVILTDGYPPYHVGGAEVIASWYACEFVHVGHEVTVITTVQELDLVGESVEAGVRVIRIFATRYHRRWRQYVSLWNPSITKKVEQYLKEVKPDIVHAHNVHQYLSWQVLSVARRHAKAVVYHAHDAMAFHFGKLIKDPTRGLYVSWWDELLELRLRFNPWYRSKVRAILNSLKLRIVVSESLKQALETNGVHSVTVVHNGIDSNWGIVDSNNIDQFRSIHNLTGMRTVLMAGRLAGAKGLDLVPELIEKLSDIQNIRFIVASRGVDSRNEKIIPLGWLSTEEMKLAYHVTDVVLVPSLYEDPFPTINLEAMICSRPVVGTKFGGTPEIVQDGVTGFIVNPFDIVQTTKRIRELLEDENLRLKFGQAGRNRVLEKFTLSKQAIQMVELFEEALRT